MSEWSVKYLLDTWLGIGANWHHKSVWCSLMSNTHMDVILWSVCYFHAYCTIYLSHTITRLKMYLVISCGSKYKKISLSLSAFCMSCYAGRFIPPRFSSLHVHPANEVTPYTDWALPRVHGVGHGGIDIEQGNHIPCLNQLLVEPVPLNTVKLPIR